MVQVSRHLMLDSEHTLQIRPVLIGIPRAVPREMATETELNRISELIIGGGVVVHRRVGPGCLESAYSPCLALELHKRGLEFRTKVSLTLEYDELIIPRAYEADFVVEDEVVIEVKALAVVGHRERRQLQTYLELG